LKWKAVDHNMFNNWSSKIVHSELENGDVERLPSRDILLVKRNIYYLWIPTSEKYSQFT